MAILPRWPSASSASNPIRTDAAGRRLLPGWSLQHFNFRGSFGGASNWSTAFRSDINRAATEERRIRIIAREVVPVIYGRVRMAPGIFVAEGLPWNSAAGGARIILGFLWGVGPLSAPPTILDSTTGEAVDWGSFVNPHTTVSHQVGSPLQTPHPWLTEAISGYNDNLIAAGPGGTSVPLAYSVVRTPVSQGMPSFVGEVDGLNLFNPATGLVEPASKNPALWLLDFLSNPVYGCGQPVDLNGSIPAIEACSQVLAGQPRRWGGLLINTAADYQAHIEALRTYAGCIVTLTDQGFRLVPKRPADVVRHIAADKWIGPLAITRTARSERPTVVTITYTDTSSTVWKSEVARATHPGVLTGAMPFRESTVSLPGIQSHRVAYREAVERLNHANLSILRFEGVTTDESLASLAGDVVTITHPDGITVQPVRITKIVPIEPGRWQIYAEQYHWTLYSDAIQEGPLTVGTNLTTPTTPPPAPTGLTLTEEVYQTQTGIWATRIRATWNALTSPHVVGYKAEVFSVIGGVSTRVWEFDTGGTDAVTGAVQELVQYRVEVRGRTALVSGAAAIQTITAQGKYLPPGNVPQMTATLIAPNAVRLTWMAAIDVDIWRYEVRRGTNWDTATLVNRTDGLVMDVTDLPLATHVFMVKAIDSVGLFSPEPAYAWIALMPPPAPIWIEAFEVGGEVRMSWPAASFGTGEGGGSNVSEPFIKHYEIRYGDPVSFNWATATMLQRVDGLRHVTRELAAGTWRIAIKSVDTAGRYSTEFAHIDVEVTLDDQAFLASRADFTNPELTNMASFRLHGSMIYVTDSGQTWAARYPNAMSTYTLPIAAYQTAPASLWVSEVHDVGTVVSGNWQGQLSRQALVGAVTANLMIGETFPLSIEPLSVKRSGRYVRLRANGAAGSVIQITVPVAMARVDAVAREESGQVTTASSGPTTVTLNNTYGFVTSVVLTPVGTQARHAVVDNIQMGNPARFDIWLFNAAGAQVAGPVRWHWKGV